MERTSWTTLLWVNLAVVGSLLDSREILTLDTRPPIQNQL